jgi:hypothetical protein
MTTKTDVDFIRRVVSNLICGVEDRDWNEVEISTAILATELGMDVPAPLKAKMQAAFAEQDA